ncbi:MAG: 3-dehydroquinate synthase [Candidatus Omnitrophota bacterium]
MKYLRVRLENSPYSIIVGRGVIKRASILIKKLKLGNFAYIITNSYLKKKYLSLLVSSLRANNFNFRVKLVPDTEKSKSFKMISEVAQDMARYSTGKKIFVIALGGGVIGDLTGFVSAIYKRGVPYIQVPTTLLAQVDSSIGGKTAVDLAVGKNLVGAFYQPRLVLSDISLLKTLDKRQVRAGLAEIIKYAVIEDARLFKYLEENLGRILSLDMNALEYVVSRCAGIKARIIEEDALERSGRRTILNFGHTLGHAIEVAGHYRVYNHGEAIALGALAASFISYQKGWISKKVLERIRTLIKRAGLPVKLNKVRYKDIINAHFYDKKFSGKRNRFVLIKKVGQAKIADNIPLGLIREALSTLF